MSEAMPDVDELIDQIMIVNSAFASVKLEENHDMGKRGHVIERTAERLGWEVSRLRSFTEMYGPMLSYQEEAVEIVEEEPEPEEMVQNLIPSDRPSNRDLAIMVAQADSTLKAGLQTLDLSEEEAESAEALAKFNGSHFLDSCEMISANVLQTAIKLSTQQRKIERRLETVRGQIQAMDVSKVDNLRERLVEEERLLIYQYVDIGRLLTDIQANWYKGAAQLAIIKMEMDKKKERNGELKGRTQRSNKPGFSPQISAPVDV